MGQEMRSSGREEVRVFGAFALMGAMTPGLIWVLKRRRSCSSAMSNPAQLGLKLLDETGM